MTERIDFKVGDSVRLLRVPEQDVNDKLSNSEPSERLATAKIFETMIEQTPIVIIDQVDEYNQPWFSARVIVDGQFENHSLAIMDEESWEVVYQNNGNSEPPKEHEIAKVKVSIDRVMEEFEEDYLKLSEESEVLFEAQEALNQKYESLDKTTGLSLLFKKMEYLEGGG
ncbi:hypothetical protein [Vibrio sp. HN007]|uniref:hypothetical protein n=1 Tax=Vibrio iocasae TaxID=3098914 RepID=UPI0035D439DC